MNAARAHRGTVYEESAEVLSQEAFPGEQYVLRLRAPRVAAAARPGQFAHLQCDPALPMRRPLSIMLAEPHHGVVSFLYKVVGRGTALLAQRRPGDRLPLLGPIGRGFEVTVRRPVLLGGGVGIPPMIFLADRLRGVTRGYEPLVLMGSELPFPFQARPSRFVVPGMPEGVIAAMPLLEDWRVPSRLASRQGFPGCFEGYVTDLARAYLEALPATARREAGLYACGPHPMLEAAARLAQDFGLPCQVSLEEFMACAVGGCAGCAVPVHTEQGLAMRRVCVDGPVFDGAAVFPGAGAPAEQGASAPPRS